MPAPSVLDVLEAASLDEVGVLTKRAWVPPAQRDLVVVAGAGSVAPLLLIDLDHFKQCNDAYGHLAGDHVLVAVVRAIRTELRHVDLVGRYGGDEIAVLLAGDVTGEGVAGIAERIRARVALLRVAVPSALLAPDAPPVVEGLSVSIGAALPAPGACLRLDVLIAAADRALFRAKDAGRNTVCVVEVAAESWEPAEPRHAR